MNNMTADMTFSALIIWTYNLLQMVQIVTKND